MIKQGAELSYEIVNNSLSLKNGIVFNETGIWATDGSFRVNGVKMLSRQLIVCCSSSHNLVSAVHLTCSAS